VIVDRWTGGLNDKDIIAPDVLTNLDEDLTITEGPHLGLGEFHAHVATDIGRQFTVSVASEYLHVFWHIVYPLLYSIAD
jgi:hypothetical protein